MSYELRPYQQDAVTRGLAHLQRDTGQGGLIVLPPGAGKSLVIASIATGLPDPCLVLQPSKEILAQNANKLHAYGFTPAIYSASMGAREVGQITLATIGTIRKVPDLFQHFPTVLVDECHLVNAKEGVYREFFAALGDIRVLGLTATPYRLTTDGYGGSQLKFLTRTRPRVFSKVVAYAQVGDLIAQGFLVKPTYHAVTGFDRTKLPLNTTGADFEDTALQRYYNQIGFHARLVKVITRLRAAGRKRILVFTRFVEDAANLSRAFANELAVVSADTHPKQRDSIVADFRAGKIPVVATVGVLATGFDYPELDTVVMARPTVSLALHYQQIGRVLRPSPLKPDAWVIDMVDQMGVFGPVESLWLQPGGASGEQWEVVSRSPTGSRTLTNTYFGEPSKWAQRKRRA